MKVIVFGASGGAGKHVVEHALAAGHDVTAAVRNPSAFAQKHERLRVVASDVTDAASVADALAGQEAVVTTIGPRPGTPPGTLISGSVRHILAGMQKHGVKRLVFTSGLMVGEARGVSSLARLTIKFFRRINRALYLDKVVAEQLLLDSPVEWTIVRPPNFDDRQARGAYRLGADLDVKVTSTMSASDVGASLLEAVTEPRHVKQVLDVSN